MRVDTSRTERIRALFAQPEDPYAGGDIEVARRMSAGLWRVGLVFVLLLLPVSQPYAALGGWGWAVVAALAVGTVAIARWISARPVTWNFLLAASYVGVAHIAVLEWLGGGASSPYDELYLLIALAAGGMHPPRRVLGVLAAIAVAAAAPLVYGDATSAMVGRTALQVVLLSACAVIAAVLMRNVRAQRLGLRDRGERAERLARVDELTELPNRRAFGEALSTEIVRARRFGSPLALVIADLDGFKPINDTHGHPAGDACLRAVADALRATLRQYDTCFRWGGDEFALLLPATAAEDAEVVCRRVVSAVAGCEDPAGRPLRITCAPAALADGMSSEDLLLAADGALLERKRTRGLRLVHSA